VRGLCQMWIAINRNQGHPVKPTALVTMLLLALSAPRYGAAAEPSLPAEQDSPIAADGEVSADETRSILVDNHPDGTWTLTVDGREVSRGTSTIDPLAVPKEIDLEITAGDGAGGILKGIYEVGEKTRRLCFRGGNGWRPREFSGAAGNDSVLIVFERE
jgi:uncharacterized protein (TIGR03067 family)